MRRFAKCKLKGQNAESAKRGPRRLYKIITLSLKLSRYNKKKQRHFIYFHTALMHAPQLTSIYYMTIHHFTLTPLALSPRRPLHISFSEERMARASFLLDVNRHINVYTLNRCFTQFVDTSVSSCAYLYSGLYLLVCIELYRARRFISRTPPVV